MTTYQDSVTMWHDKPTNNGEPSSNNCYIYSAYSKYLAPKTLDKRLVQKRYNECLRSLDPLLVDRLPHKIDPPVSKDEIIGMVSLGLLTSGELEASHFNFCNINSDFDRKLTLSSFIKAVKGLYKIRKEHRNYAWENDLTGVYPLMFKLSPVHSYYVKRFYSKRATVLEFLAFNLNIINVYFNGNKSSRMILWLQANDIGHFITKYLPMKKWVTTYFGKDHTFTKNLE